jgi:hypothetical protein
MSAGELASLSPERLAQVDLVITSYGSLLRIPWIVTTKWNLAVLDEAQAIKNPGAKQTHAARKLAAHARIALAGTPVENRLGESAGGDSQAAGASGIQSLRVCGQPVQDALILGRNAERIAGLLL